MFKPGKQNSVMYAMCIIICTVAFFTVSVRADSSDSLKIEALTAILREQFRDRELDSAWATVDRIKEIAENSDMQLKKADCFSNYGLIERVRGDLKSSISYYQKAAQHYSTLKEWALAARMHTSLGQIHISQQMYGPALEEFSVSFAYRSQLNDSLGMANNLINMGGASYYAGHMERATDYYYRALRIVDDLNNMHLKAQIIMNVSNIHIKQNNYDKAIEYLEQALELRKQLGDSKGESDVLLNLGIAWYEHGNLNQAEVYYKQSLAIKELLGNDVNGIMKITNNLGLIYKEHEDNTSAVFYFNKALEMAQQSGDQQTKASVLNNLGTRMLALDQTEQALVYLLKSLDISLRLGLKKTELSNYDNIRKLYAHNQNFEKAYEYLQKFQQLNDSLYNIESAARIAELQTMYDTEIKEKENQFLRGQSRIMGMRFTIMTISAVTIAFVALAFIILFGLKRKSLRQSRALLATRDELHRVESEKSKQEQEHLKEVLIAEEEINRLQKQQLQEKDRELTTSTLHIINKNEVLNNVRQKAQKSIEGDACQGIACIEQLIQEIDSNINLDEQWELFKRHFESVHTGFFSRLNQKYNNLTQNELKLCAYLRMNLSSKEIAQMLNIEVESAITKRYRLRKKLNLQSDENLISFLMQF